VDEEVSGVTLDRVEQGVIAANAKLEPGALDARTLALARSLCHERALGLA
jgi:hypothetical protein